MQADEREYSIEELAAAADVPVRTVRFYIGRGLLPGPGGRGKAASYGEEHLVRLRLIRLLGERRVPLDEVGRRLQGLDTAHVRELLAEERGRQEELNQAAASPSPKDYVAALLRRAGAPPPR
jgi:DNA-binding transcriptional MerR regulator